ncbi:MAG: trehalose utilization protein ThuA [Ruminococcaceae bacterium]|nr:trehalose utilization protein ThuA [Oscillospiraceae bacterium]
MSNKIRVTVWNEFRHEKEGGAAQEVYPNGLHAVIKEFLDKNEDMEVRLAALDDPDQGLPDEVLNNTDVLLWWGHCHHWEVKDELVEKVRQRVYRDGMGFIALHSGHHSKPFKAIVGCTGDLEWGDGVKEVVWNLNPSHPIAAGIPKAFELPVEELYSEPFFVPQPDQLVFGSWFEQGNIFRSGICYFRGLGKIFYFQPGHEEFPSFYNEYVQKIITNAVYWAKPNDHRVTEECPYVGTGLFDKSHEENNI